MFQGKDKDVSADFGSEDHASNSLWELIDKQTILKPKKK